MADDQDNLRVIKLTSGETIVGKIYLNDKRPFLKVENPVQFTMMFNGRSRGSLVASKWVETEETVFNISMHNVIATALPNEMLRDYYHGAYEDIQNESYDEHEQDSMEELAELWLESTKETIH